jgi:5-methylcytosine-specific restriction endonuclease McrA
VEDARQEGLGRVMKPSLTAEQVAEIKASAESSGVLAPRYGVSATRICQIRQGEASKELKRAAQQRWLAANPSNRDRNRELSRESQRRRLADPAHRELRRQATRRWLEDPANAERNRELSRRLSLRWAAENPGKVLAKRAKRRAVKMKATVGDPKAVAAVYERAKSDEAIPCAYCGKETERGKRHVDHAIALAHEDRGPHSAENLVIACAPCNLRKGVKTPDEFQAYLSQRAR